MMHHTIAGGEGVPLHVVETGDPAGRSILFLHGFSQSWLAWSRQLSSDLASDFRLVACDLRGHGRSGKPPDAYGDSKQWADDVRSVIEALQLDQPILCGWSYASLVILDYLRHYGDARIGGLQFIGGVTKLGSEQALAALTPAFLGLIPGFFSDDAEESVRSLESLLRLCLIEAPAEADACLAVGWAVLTPPHVRRALFARSIDNDDLLPTIRKPVLITQGTADAIVKPEIVREHHARIRHAQIHLMDNAGHAPFWEDVQRFNRRLRAFAAEC